MSTSVPTAPLGSIRSPLTRRLVHFTELDGLRGIAAILVFFHHVCFTSLEPQGWNSFVRTVRSLSIPGDAGVDLFFVLSGFLITSLLLEARDKPSYYHDFYWKRALRILPLYFLVLLGVLLFDRGSGGYVLISALFVSNFALFFHIASHGPFWTLAIEEQFYLVWPAFIRRRTIAQLRRWALVIALTSVGLRFAAAAIGHHTYYYTFFRCDGLAAGACIAFWFYARSRERGGQTGESKILAVLAVSGALFCGLSVWKPTTPRPEAFVAAFYQTGVTLVCIFLIAYAIKHSGSGHLAFLRSRFLTFFGLISYALYMVHLYVMYVYDALHPLAVGDMAGYLLRFGVILAVTVVLCLLSRHLIELPANSLRKYVLSAQVKTT